MQKVVQYMAGRAKGIGHKVFTNNATDGFHLIPKQVGLIVFDQQQVV